MSRDPFSLAQVQRWMQAVLMHPGGAAAGVESPRAQAEWNVGAQSIESVICRSRALTSLDRLQIYAGAYYARLLECLRTLFGALAHALGEEAFDALAYGYLQEYPSRGYSLHLLGQSMPTYLRERGPRGDEAMLGDFSWPDFMIELAEFELLVHEVFDGPGIERASPLDESALMAIDPAAWPAARLVPAPCLRVCRYAFPVPAYYAAYKRDESPPPLAPRPTHAAVFRRDFVVCHYELTEPQYELLQAIVSGRTVGEAIGRAMAATHEDGQRLENDLTDWFRAWTARGFFQAVEPTNQADP